MSWRTTITHDFDLWGKLKWLLVEGVDVILTGILIWISIEHLKSDTLAWRIASYGISSALAMYYFKWIVETIRGKQNIKQ